MLSPNILMGKNHVTQSHRRSADFDAGTYELYEWCLTTTLESWDDVAKS